MDYILYQWDRLPIGSHSKIWQVANFVLQVLPAAHFVSLKSGLPRSFPIKRLFLNYSVMHLISSSAYQFIGGKNDSKSNTD